MEVSGRGMTIADYVVSMIVVTAFLWWVRSASLVV